MKNDRWVKRWQVENSQEDGFWIVAIDKNGQFGCSCPVWKFRRQECKHIQYIKAHPKITPSQVKIKHPELIPANVKRPKFDKKENTILYPLVPIGCGVWMEATICYFLMEHGFSWSETKERRRHIPHSWTKHAVYNYINQHGLAEYEDYLPHNNKLIRQAG